MLRPLDEWDSDYVDEIAKLDESADLEKKASDAFTTNAGGGISGATRDEIAKQVCAFSNTGDGLLVFGIPKAGGVDAGVPELVGRTPTKDCVEQLIPTLLHKVVYGCKAAWIHKPGHHAAARGTLVIYVPLSAHRPHWVTESGRDVAYIRAGAHSLPMRLQTFLDMHSRTDAQQGEILSFGKRSADRHEGGIILRLLPRVQLLAGPVAKTWGFQLTVPERGIQFEIPGDGRPLESSGQNIIIHGQAPLFPGRVTPVGPIHCYVSRSVIGSDQKIRRRYTLKAPRRLARAFQLKSSMSNQRKSDPAPLDLATILAWARRHHERTGAWPRFDGGPIAECPGET